MDTIDNYDFRLNIPDDVMVIIENKRILVEDVKKVINNSKRNKEYFFNPYTLQYVTRLKLNNISYWVRYIEKMNEIDVISVTAIEWKLLCYSWGVNIPTNS